MGPAGGARDAEGRRRIGVWLPDPVIEWLDRTAARDGSTRSDLLEGIVLLAVDDSGEDIGL